MQHTVYISAVIQAPLEKVWPHFRDFNGMPAWHPGIAKSVIEGDGRGDVLGSVRYLTLAPTGFVREQLLMIDDTEHALRYSIIETDLPMRNYVAGVAMHRVTQDDTTFVQWWADFDVDAGVTLQDVAAAVGKGVFAAGLAALNEKLKA